MPGNRGATETLIAALDQVGNACPIWYASSTKASDATPYGISKAAAEDVLRNYGMRSGANVTIARLPNVFGKWCRPNYNSAVATFCYNVARDLPIEVHDVSAPITLVHVDDVVSAIIAWLHSWGMSDAVASVEPTYETKIGTVADLICSFADNRHSGMIDRVGTGFIRALYATYVSYLPVEDFAYPLVAHSDPRGMFAEVLKTRDSGQFSFFTAHPGITRGGHYHHAKTEKFLVVAGRARFTFRHMGTGERYEIHTEGSVPVVVETVPGWTHDITNVGETELISLLWANEIFDPARPDTIAAEV